MPTDLVQSKIEKLLCKVTRNSFITNQLFTSSPVKVAILLNELSLPFKTENVEFADMKKEAFTKLNPNGRAPALHDPNTGITLWESGAIILYLIETYDKEGKLSYSSIPEKFQLQQWLMFQVSGQGPYYGQAAWFQLYHHEKLPSAVERYLKEAERVVGVLDSWLKTHEWLVGDKMTFADLSFVPYANFMANTPWLNQDGKLFENGKYPAYQAWVEKLVTRESVKKGLN